MKKYLVEVNFKDGTKTTEIITAKNMVDAHRIAFGKHPGRVSATVIL